MLQRSRLLLACLCASLLLAVAVDAAQANSLSVNEQSIRFAWSALVFEGGGSAITCELTLNGSFHSSTIAKVRESLIGAVTGGSVGGCRGGSMTIHAETLPWHLQYGGFTGTLPTIERVQLNLVGVRWRWHPEGSIECEAGTTQREPGILTALLNTRHQVTSQSLSGTIALRGNFLCEFATGTLSGTGTMTTSTGGTVSLTLIESESTPPSLSPTSIEFGRLAAEGVARRRMTLTAGTAELTVNRISVASSAYFAITDPNGCVGRRLAARASCTFNVVYAAPEATERSVETTLTAETTAGSPRATLRGST